MSEYNEMLADLLAEMGRRENSRYYPKVARNIMRQYRTRIEAAHRREVDKLNAEIDRLRREKTPSNAAKLRSALAKIRDMVTADAPADEVEIANIAYFALAEPMRECDRFTDAESARRAWLDDEESWDEFGSPKLKLHEWLFAPATERKGEGGGSK